MRFDDGIFGLYSRAYENRREVEYSIEDYLRACSDDPSYYAGAAERLPIARAPRERPPWCPARPPTALDRRRTPRQPPSR